MNALLRKLGIRLPIIQAPMAGISTPEMAAAVSNFGGLGSIGVGNVDAEVARGMIRRIRQLADRPLNVNLFCHQPAASNRTKEANWLRRLKPCFERFGAEPPEQLREIYTSFVADDAMLAMLVEERPAVVSFHFGLPSSERIAALKAAGIVLLGTATSLAEARANHVAGIDAIVAQGFEAGGHRGVFDPTSRDDCLGVLPLTRLLAKEIPIPIVAAGGIMDGAGIAASLMLGASAAQLGTAFVRCPESKADAGYRAAVAKGGATLMTSVISGRPARSLANRFTELGLTTDIHEIPAYPIAYDAGKQLHEVAKATGEFGFGAQWAGQGVSMSRELPAAELMDALQQELKQALAQTQLSPAGL